MVMNFASETILKAKLLCYYGTVKQDDRKLMHAENNWEVNVLSYIYGAESVYINLTNPFLKLHKPKDQHHLLAVNYVELDLSHLDLTLQTSRSDKIRNIPGCLELRDKWLSGRASACHAEDP